MTAHSRQQGSWISNKGVFTLCLILLAQWTVLLSGCTPPRYVYEEIKTTYGRGKNGALASASKAHPDVPSGPITLRDAIGLVLENNPEIDMAVARIRQSEAMIDEALSAFWPVVSAYAEYMQGDAPSAYLFKTIDQRKLPPGVDFNKPGWFENYEIGVRARVNLFNGGRDVLRRRMAETGLEIQDLDHQSVENALIASTIQAYYNALAAREYILIARDSVSTVKTQLRIMEVRYRAGGVLRSDILSLKVRLAQAKEDLVRAENNYSLSVAALANLLGLDPDTTLTLEEEGRLTQDMPADYESGLIYALATRAELKKTRQQIIRSRMALDRARSQVLPSLDFRAKYYFDDPSLDFERDRENWTAGIILNWDLFTGLSTRAETAKARAVLEEMLAVDRQIANSVQLDLKTAYLRLAEARARLAVTKAGSEEAEESLRLVRKQYEGGSATITRYLDAELARDRTRMRAAAAFYDIEKAGADLGRALGYWGKHGLEVMRRDE